MTPTASVPNFMRFLWATGHFWNPKYPDTHNVTETEVSRLTLNDRAAQLAVKSYQESDSNLVPLVRAFHQRAPIPDGLVGPATLALVGVPRCPLPDHPPPLNTTFTYEDPGLLRAVQSMQAAAATGSGSWPAGCHGAQGVHEVKISYDLSKLSAKHREWWPEIKRRSHEAVAAVGLRLIEVPVGERANITVTGRNFAGSVIGMAEFNSQGCGETHFCQLSPSYAPDVDMVLNLLLHENGHNWNLQHKAGNIMNPSILRTPTAWVQRSGGTITYQDNSYPTLKRFFGGEPVSGTDGPDGPPPPPPLPGAALVRVWLDGKLIAQARERDVNIEIAKRVVPL